MAGPRTRSEASAKAIVNIAMAPIARSASSELTVIEPNPAMST